LVKEKFEGLSEVEGMMVGDASGSSPLMINMSESIKVGSSEKGSEWMRLNTCRCERMREVTRMGLRGGENF
jgi:hypothetical protein